MRGTSALACGLALLMLAACAAPAEESPSPAAGGFRVVTDWSRLEERETPLPAVGSRWYEDYTDRLIPGEDYGMLVPYAGLRLMDDWPAETGCLYGLMTAEGTVVTDPVYSRVYRPGWWGSSGWNTLPLLVLVRGEESTDGTWDPVRYAVAAPDGSWCTGFSYRAVAAGAEGLMLFTDSEAHWMTVEGAFRGSWTAAEMGMTEEDFRALLSDLVWGEGLGGDWKGDLFCLGLADGQGEQVVLFHLSDGTRSTMPVDRWMALGQEDGPAVEPPDSAVLGLGEDWFVDWYWDSLLGTGGGGMFAAARYGENGMERRFYWADGSPVAEADGLDPEAWYCRADLVGGLLEVLDRNTASYYDPETGTCVFRTSLGFE